MKCKVFTSQNASISYKVNNEWKSVLLENSINSFLSTLKEEDIINIIQTQSGRMDNNVTITIWYK